MPDAVSLSLDAVHALAVGVCTANGLSGEHARAIADTVTAAERDRCHSHGLFRIPGYVASVRSGKVDPKAVPEVTRLAPGVLRVDARGGFAPLALHVGREPLIECAGAQGVAVLGIGNVYHFAALWPEVEAIAEAGLVAFAFTGAFSYVAPAGGSRPLYGTNPMAFAWPRAGRPPLVFDQASSASARGEIMLHARDGLTLPAGWAVGPDGEPTTDPEVALAGAQLPFGGYKGAAIALMVELLAGALIGEAMSFEATERDNGDGGPPLGGELMIAIDPARCVAGGDASASLAHAEALFARILDDPGTRLPSERRYAARRAGGDISVPRPLHDELQALSAR